MATSTAPDPPSLLDVVSREILLSFWKTHILHHAAARPVYGLWIAKELRRHGYHISPGTLYPLLTRMEKHGWLRSQRSARCARNARKEYRLTPAGARVLALVRAQVRELYREVILEARPARRHERK